MQCTVFPCFLIVDTQRNELSLLTDGETPRGRFGSQSDICIRANQWCHGLLRSRGTRERILISFRSVCSREKSTFFFCEDCKLATPLSFFKGLWTSFSCPAAASFLFSFVASLVVFDVLGFSLNDLSWFSRKLHWTKKGMQSQCRLEWEFLAGRKQITSSQSTCVRDDLLFRSFAIARFY